MKVLVGSTNNVKVNAVKSIFTEYDVDGISVDSGVSDQPFSDDETIQGAINRAMLAKDHADIGIGLEAGVVKTKYGTQLINWGALVDSEQNIMLAGGTRIILPDDVAKHLNGSNELGNVMDEYANRKGVKHNEGAIGIFTNNIVIRQDIFEHIAKLLYGQLLFNKK
ncbi:DUF84 family protein [Haloplasma contractile]|uniref:inosine/xanthosine triphosphatase n=1 Tax=Haloplasma contractile SSD-17B TaxID=1033810 RepID=U2EG76_9MOLU|nr:DUF84 family protein [Haloplasma contractile]ERJ13621.1 putative non-canonical purine NTP phosphatase protein [Haloplasma contractile SSD-17B]